MKFCATYRVPHSNWRQVLHTFSSLTPEERADVGEGVTLIGRWHDMSSRSGVAILETDDAAARSRSAPARLRPDQVVGVGRDLIIAGLARTRLLLTSR